MSDPAVAHTEPRKPATWRKVLAAILDFAFILIIAGYAVGSATGGLTESGFSLQGGPAFVAFAIVIAYFVVLPLLGGTLFQRLLRAR